MTQTQAMDTNLQLRQPWAEVKEKLKEQDITLTDDDLVLEPGQEAELIDRLSRKMKKTPEEVKAYIESVASNTAKSG